MNYQRILWISTLTCSVALAQAPVTIKVPTTPTEYAQCDEMNAQNRRIQIELSNAWGGCHTTHRDDFRSYRSDVCRANGVLLGTYSACTGSLSNYCNVVTRITDAYADCRSKVQQYKAIHTLVTSRDAEEREKDEIRSAVWRITSETSTAARIALPRPAAKIFRSQLGKAQVIHDNVLSELDAALKVSLGYGGPPRDDRLALLLRDHRNHPVIAVKRAVEATKVGSPTDSRSLQAAYDHVKVLALAGSGIAARVLAEVHLNGVNTNKDVHRSAAWNIYAAAHGSELALNNIGVYFADTIKDAAAAKEWYELAATHGSPTAMFNLAKIYWSEKNPERARRWTSQLQKLQSPFLQELPFKVDIGASSTTSGSTLVPARPFAPAASPVLTAGYCGAVVRLLAYTGDETRMLINEYRSESVEDLRSEQQNIRQSIETYRSTLRVLKGWERTSNERIMQCHERRLAVLECQVSRATSGGRVWVENNGTIPKGAYDIDYGCP